MTYYSKNKLLVVEVALIDQFRVMTYCKLNFEDVRNKPIKSDVTYDVIRSTHFNLLLYLRFT